MATRKVEAHVVGEFLDGNYRIVQLKRAYSGDQLRFVCEKKCGTDHAGGGRWHEVENEDDVSEALDGLVSYVGRQMSERDNDRAA